jgi:hypothetical protein
VDGRARKRERATGEGFIAVVLTGCLGCLFSRIQGSVESTAG